MSAANGSASIPSARRAAARSAAAVADRVEAGAAIAEQALELTDPWESFTFLVERICALQAGDRILGELALRNPPSAALERAREHGHALMRRIIVRAQEAGALRPDWTLEDIAFITWSHTSVVAATANVAPELWRRNLALILDGLRAKAAHPLPVPALTEDQLMQAMRG